MLKVCWNNINGKFFFFCMDNCLVVSVIEFYNVIVECVNEFIYGLDFVFFVEEIYCDMEIR